MKGNINAVAFVLAALFASGCATGPSYSVADLDSLDADELCAAYKSHRTIRYEIGLEMEKRGLITPAESSTIDGWTVREGMSRCAVLAIWGEPDQVGSSPNLQLETWIYCWSQMACTGGVPQTHLMFHNDKVASMLKVNH